MLWIATSLQASGTVQVHSMNYPAWLVRGDETRALSPDTRLENGDLIRTGDGGRMLLKLADGSAVKLGEAAEFRIESVELRDDADLNLLDVTFDVLKGAFRLTSAFFNQVSARHQVDVRIGAITAGIRGTDIWGRSNSEQDLVCLIEGTIQVEIPEQPTLKMNDPLSFFVKPRGELPYPVAPVDPEKLQQWATETELDESNGIAGFDGEWALVLQSFSRSQLAETKLRELRQQGYAAELIEVDIDGQIFSRLILPRFVSSDAARNARNLAAARLSINDAWVFKPE